LNKVYKKLFVCINYHICIDIYKKITIILNFWDQRFGATGVGAPTPILERACRRSQNGPADAPAGYKFGGSGEDALRFVVLTLKWIEFWAKKNTTSHHITTCSIFLSLPQPPSSYSSTLHAHHSIDDGCYACRDRLGQELTRLSGRRQSARCVFEQELLLPE
jgi:hypothetical protein